MENTKVEYDGRLEISVLSKWRVYAFHYSQLSNNWFLNVKDYHGNSYGTIVEVNNMRIMANYKGLS